MDSWKKRKGKNTSCDVQVIMLCLRASELIVQGIQGLESLSPRFMAHFVCTSFLSLNMN